jgi:diaminopimelate epimerase
MDIAFLKLQAGGNDYLCIDEGKTQAPAEKHLGPLAKKMCDRRLGVGGEGLILLAADDKKKISARVLTPEGTEGETCGAALQCAARYAFDAGLVTEKTFAIRRGKRPVPLEIIDSSNIRQDVGAPLALDKAAELKELSDIVFTKPIVIENHEYSCTPVVLEETHAVLFAASFGLPLPRLARQIESHPLFPDGADVVFMRVFSREELQARAWKRGGPELHSCPRVASAGLVAAALNGFAEREALVHQRGGDMFVEWDESSNHVFFTGPVEYVFSGNFYFEE